MKKPTKVIKVETDSFYKEKYVQIDNIFYSTTLAKSVFPYLVKKVDKVHNSLKPAKNAIQVTYKPYPDNYKMLETLLKERQEIYKFLNINGVTGKGADIVKAGVLFLYLSKHLTYNDLVSEEIFKKEPGIFLSKLIADNIKEYYTLKQQSKQNVSKRENRQIEERLSNLTQKNMMLQNKLKGKKVNLENRNFLKSVYSALINNRGVCVDFSYAYQFLLEGLNIESLVTTIQSTNNVFNHTINANSYMENGVKKYYLVDITEGNSIFNVKNNTSLLYAFGKVKSSLEENKIIFVEKLVNLKNFKMPFVESIDFTKNIKQVEDNIATNIDYLQKHIYNLEDFIMNGCKDVNLDEVEKEK